MISIKQILPFCFLIILPFLTSAQNQYVGIKGGYISSFATFTDYQPEINPHSGIYAAFNYDYELKNRLDFGFEVAYEGRGFMENLLFGSNIDPRSPYKNINKKDDLIYNFNYISFPIKVGYRSGGRFFVSGNIGICPAFITKSSISLPILDTLGNTIGQKTSDYRNLVNTLNIGLLAELGMGFKINNEIEVIASARFLEGFTPITKGYQSFDQDSYILLGFRYKLPSN